MTGATTATRTMVYTLMIETKHGASTRVFRNEESAKDALAAWAREWWPNEVARWPDAPMTQAEFDALPDGEAITKYFEAVHQYEWYDLEEAHLED